MGGSSFGWEERVLTSPAELAVRRRLIESRGLSLPEGADLVLGLFENDAFIATGSLVGPVLQGIAVADCMEGEGAAAAVVSALIRHALKLGYEQLFLFTSAREAARFEALGFSPIASTPSHEGQGVALLEWGSRGLTAWLEGLKALAGDKPDNAGAVVVNCNPFTLGHRSLIEYAASRAPWLYVLVVEEDRSLFPFKVRLDLVRKGTADLPNVTVLPGGPYVISSATFPTYFIRPGERKEGESDPAVEMHAALDLLLFRRYIAPALKVTERFVGTEPYCATTSAYNRIMKEILVCPEGDGPALRVHEMPRFEKDGSPVSASTVRGLIRNGEMAAIRDIVPETTWSWLVSPEAVPVIERIRYSDSRH
ncbi:MAG: [citrate (pro-3S)-lyase] ligase [Rectinemataceae bacterium]|nr:[citrate (pro-3S)-lyase] ligase [Rectinemataceae bacterium]